jgi:hypothetical protein
MIFEMALPAVAEIYDRRRGTGHLGLKILTTATPGKL